MLLFEAALVVMLVTFEMQQIQFVDQAAGFQKLERPIDRNAVEPGILLFGHLIETLGVQM